MLPNASDATIPFVPRETVSQTLECLERLIALTPQPYDLLAVVAGYPADLVAAIRQRLDSVGGRMIVFPHYLTPNEARNAALAKTTTEYIVFLDHDVHVGENWLAPLVACARETGAAIVSPLIFEHEPLFTYLHLDGGEAGVDPLPSGFNTYRDIHHHAHKPLSDIAEPITRHRTGLIEFHTVLVETQWLRSVGGLDPELLSLLEHWDMCIAAQKTGRSIYVEPESKVTYVPVKRVTLGDARWFTLRWSDAWANDSFSRIAEKHGISPEEPSFDGLRIFLQQHRGYRYAPLKKRMKKLLGKRAGPSLTKRVPIPVSELWQNVQLRQDLALWRKQHDEARSPYDFGNKS